MRLASGIYTGYRKDSAGWNLQHSLCPVSLSFKLYSSSSGVPPKIKQIFALSSITFIKLENACQASAGRSVGTKQQPHPINRELQETQLILANLTSNVPQSVPYAPFLL